MRTKEELEEKIIKLNNKITNLKAEEPEKLSNELKVVLAGSQLQAILINSVLDSDEETIRSLLKRFEDRGVLLQKNYEEVSKYNQIEQKNDIHAMIWTNDIRIDTYKWILDEEDTDI